MAWTTPLTWNTGRTVTATDMNLYVSDNLSYLYTAYTTTAAWTAYTPSATGFTAVTYTSQVGAYTQTGSTVTGRAYMAFSALTPGTSVVTFNLPVAAATATGGMLIGTSRFRSNAGTNSSGAVMSAAAGGTVATVLTHSPGGANTTLLNWTGAVPAGQVAGDSWWFTFTYQAA